MSNFLNFLIARNDVKVLITFIVFDTIFGILRAIKQKKLNSNIGIDGIIRKAGMLISMLFFSVIDFIMKIDFISFIPTELKEFLKLENVGISNLFILLFILFEILSVLKNMTLCKLPIPKKFQKFLEKLMKEFTKEIEEKEGEKDAKAE
ncbi:phage holin family protein [bacterium]|nr:phage holin family protein [bacterium]